LSIAIGNLLRDPSINDATTDTHWSTSLLFSCILDILPLYKQTGNLQGNALFNWSVLSSTAESPLPVISLDLGVLEVIDRYNAFVNRIEELGLPAAIQEKPRLDVGLSHV
jgi:tRNA nucleotidyltransferase (CCA-adding enzyme)